ncbi:hypothetical protein PR202_ga16065 [Eleusine coracana subsp. coracana]|uniref:Protein kinase domain-containing protein n=1 Tax=Eleusine coracana subsp. coracana TaxID=191504 RepID=A0AAV5CKM6_ELECO|nr:hypothetical protein PR202_ga16065 [Eleusine coracana subsp. coracana]
MLAPDFLSLDCGLLDGAGYKDTTTGIEYVPDGRYVDSGEKHENAQLRQFDIYFNGDRLVGGSSPYSPSYLVATCVYTSVAIPAVVDGQYNITLVSTAKSVLPPMINAIEIYTLVPRNSPTTFSKDSKNHAAETLTWGTRLRIVLEAAQGLDYLHKGCSPPIIHRDVKSSNILLGQNLQAKIADLGLSRTYLSDVQTHISATAAGTPGFMDPEYYLNGRPTESSDVYSFGVVLLEAVTGEPPMVPGHGHIIQRIKQRVAMGDIDSVADRRLGGAYDVNSMWKVVDTALMCTADAGTGRPTMADVVAQLKESLALEEARESKYSNPTSLAGSESAALISPFGPIAR